jgi:hypothetical protein
MCFLFLKHGPGYVRLKRLDLALVNVGGGGGIEAPSPISLKAGKKY